MNCGRNQVKVKPSRATQKGYSSLTSRQPAHDGSFLCIVSRVQVTTLGRTVHGVLVTGTRMNPMTVALRRSPFFTPSGWFRSAVEVSLRVAAKVICR